MRGRKRGSSIRLCFFPGVTFQGKKYISKERNTATTRHIRSKRYSGRTFRAGNDTREAYLSERTRLTIKRRSILENL